MKTSKKITLSAGFIGFSALGLSDVSADTTDNNKEKLGGVILLTMKKKELLG